jgi:hypothetical protein
LAKYLVRASNINLARIKYPRYMILQGKRKDKKEERLKATALQFVKKQTCHD